MSLLAKILLVLNLMAALAFVVLGILVAGQENAWKYTVFLHEKAIEGKPVDKEDPDAEREATLDDIFLPAREKLAQELDDPKESEAAKRQRFDRTLEAWARPGQHDQVAKELQAVQNVPVRDLAVDLRRPLRKSQQLEKVRPFLLVKTQEEEVQRWHDYLLADIGARNGEPAKRQRLLEILVPLATTLDERAELSAKIKTGPLSDLLGPNGPFETAFRQAQGPAQSTDKKGYAIAQLLFGLAQLRGPNGKLEDPTAPTRAIVVVGLKAYNLAAEIQAKRLREMTEELRQEMYLGKNSERAQFLARHQEVLQQLQQLAVAVGEQEYVLNQVKADLANVDQQVKARETTVKEYKEKLAKAEETTKADLRKQAELESLLFKALLDQAKVANENADKEREIRRLEGLR